MKIRIGGNMSERINKYLSAHGVCSRREADRMIQEGRITIDGRIAVMGEMVEDNTIICVDGRKVDNTTPPQVVIAFNKPVGIVCTTTDKQGKNNIVDFIGYKERIYPVGRLDKESDGLILLTNDGDMMDRLLRSVNGHEKEYIVSVNKPINKEFIKRMSGGIYLKELDRTTRKCVVEKISADAPPKTPQDDEFCGVFHCIFYFSASNTASTAFWTCSRFSASVNISSAWASKTAVEISSPR